MTSSSRPLNILEVAMELSLTPAVLSAVEKNDGPEAAQAAAMSTSVGGIGPLLRERIVAQAENGANVLGVSLLYESVWAQGWQDWNHLYLERRPVGRSLRAVLEDGGPPMALPLFDGTTAQVKVRKAAYGKAGVCFLDCPDVSDVVYPCAEDAPQGTADPYAWADRQRMRQSWMVGRGALAVAKAADFKPDVIVLSETPTLFAHPRLFADAFQKDPFFQDALCVFNDHTPLEYAHPIWPKETLEKVGADPALYGPFVRNGRVDVTQLLVAISDGVFGVAKKHAQVMRAMPSLKPYADKIRSITNGVGRDFWQNPVFQRAWGLTDKDLIDQKETLKAQAMDWLWRRANLWPSWASSVRGKPLVIWTRRITSYKRLDLLTVIFDNPALRARFLKTDLVLIVGGRIYQRDNVSEKMVYRLVDFLNGDAELGDRVVFLQNYNVWDAPRIFHGADAAIMLSDDGREASATGFMKAQMNGGVVIANMDGAVPEFVFDENGARPQNGFSVGYRDGQPDPESFLKALETFSAAYADPVRRAALIRSAVAVTGDVNVDRTAREMIEYFESLPPVRPPTPAA
jgi:glucan phosphorylase